MTTDLIALDLTTHEARALLAHLQTEIRRGMASRREACFWCGAEISERDHDAECGMPLLLLLEARLTTALEDQR